MNHRLLLKTVIVATMGIVALAAPRSSEAAAAQPCYVCYQGDTCPSYEEHAAICESLGVGCPYPSECVWGTGECPHVSLLRLTCE